jgi:hypothetical protein
MRYGNYSVLIPEGAERDSGYVGLPHNQQYTIRLMSHDHRRCDAEVTVDGKPVGVFRLSGHGSMTLERSPDDHGRFTFFASGSGEASTAGEATVASADKGLIQVRFVPERRRHSPAGGIVRALFFTGMSSGEPQWSARSADYGTVPTCCEPEEKTSGGITGLSGHSSQAFTNVGAIDRDESGAVTISLRLVVADRGVRPLRATGQGNRVPAPI